MVESKIIIIEFLKRFNFEMVDKNYDLAMIARFVYEPLDTLFMKLTKNS